MWRKLKFQFRYSFELYQKISRKQSTKKKYSKDKKTMSAGINHDQFTTFCDFCWLGISFKVIRCTLVTLEKKIPRAWKVSEKKIFILFLRMINTFKLYSLTCHNCSHSALFSSRQQKAVIVPLQSYLLNSCNRMKSWRPLQLSVLYQE